MDTNFYFFIVLLSLNYITVAVLYPGMSTASSHTKQPMLQTQKLRSQNCFRLCPSFSTITWVLYVREPYLSLEKERKWRWWMDVRCLRIKCACCF